MKISGTGIKVKGDTGAYLDGQGALWWDGQGGNGGKTKPKFFAAHKLFSSSITDIYMQNTPVQAVSINGCDGLTITGMTINNIAGDTGGGHNTDGFDIGSSNNVVITGANVYNQDDCVAVNSGTVRSSSFLVYLYPANLVLENHLQWWCLLWWSWIIHWQRWWSQRQHCRHSHIR